MQQTSFGKTNLKVGRTGFGCIPIQRISYEESTALLRHAYNNGVTLYDTANMYSTSEERIGIALKDVRKDIVLCTKSTVLPPDNFMANIENSLKMLQTDYIDVLQVHNPPFMPRPGGEDGIYDVLQKTKEQGKIRHISISTHSVDMAKEAIVSGLYDTLQFALSYVSSPEELAIIGLCKEHNIGLLAMKALCGGLLTNAKAAFAFLRQYENVIPIWGMQKMSELDEFLSYEKDPPAMDEAMKRIIEEDRKALAGNFCRCCGYCLPCPANIPIPNAARMSALLGRMPSANWQTPEWQENMKRIDNCTNCGDCMTRCPYGLQIPTLLKNQQKTYFEVLNG